jgi:hypothetical protein
MPIKFALEVTSLNFGKCDQVELPLKDAKWFSIDMDDTTIIEAVLGVGVGGILGIGAFMPATRAHLPFIPISCNSESMVKKLWMPIKFHIYQLYQ